VQYIPIIDLRGLSRGRDSTKSIVHNSHQNIFKLFIKNASRNLSLAPVASSSPPFLTIPAPLGHSLPILNHALRYPAVHPRLPSANMSHAVAPTLLLLSCPRRTIDRVPSNPGHLAVTPRGPTRPPDDCEYRSYSEMHDKALIAIHQHSRGHLR